MNLLLGEFSAGSEHTVLKKHKTATYPCIPD